MNLSALTLAAILSLLPATADQVAERARLDPLAAAIAAAVLAGPLPFEGPAAKEASALLLAATAWHESGFDARVLDCRRRGSRGDASAFQLLGVMARGGHSVTEVCASMPLAARLALRVFVHHAKRCKWGGIASAWAGYGTGSCGRPMFARNANGKRVDLTAARCWTWGRLVKAAHIKGDCYRTAPITFAASGPGAALTAPGPVTP